MRKAWLKMAEAGALAPTHPGGTAPAFPGLGTVKFTHVTRITTDRIFAERRHITKMVGFYVVLFVAVSVFLSKVLCCKNLLNFPRNYSGSPRFSCKSGM